LTAFADFFGGLFFAGVVVSIAISFVVVSIFLFIARGTLHSARSYQRCKLASECSLSLDSYGWATSLLEVCPQRIE
jgi:hypothetical protein